MPGIILGAGPYSSEQTGQNLCPPDAWLLPPSRTRVYLGVSGVELYTEAELGLAACGRGTQIIIPRTLNACSLPAV